MSWDFLLEHALHSLGIGRHCSCAADLLAALLFPHRRLAVRASHFEIRIVGRIAFLRQGVLDGQLLRANDLTGRRRGARVGLQQSRPGHSLYRINALLGHYPNCGGTCSHWGWRALAVHWPIRTTTNSAIAYTRGSVPELMRPKTYTLKDSGSCQTAGATRYRNLSPQPTLCYAPFIHRQRAPLPDTKPSEAHLPPFLDDSCFHRGRTKIFLHEDRS